MSHALVTATIILTCGQCHQLGSWHHPDQAHDQHCETLMIMPVSRFWRWRKPTKNLMNERLEVEPSSFCPLTTMRIRTLATVVTPVTAPRVTVKWNVSLARVAMIAHVNRVDLTTAEEPMQSLHSVSPRLLARKPVGITPNLWTK